MNKTHLAAFVAGLLFALGLGVSGMTQPAVVLGFLDVAGDWNPALMAVMAGAIGVNLPACQWLLRLPRPLWSTSFHLPHSQGLDRRLLLGSALFGVGWGLSGYCPGTGIVAGAAGGWPAAVFTLSMLTGFWLYKRRQTADFQRIALEEMP
ncbi:MAG: YeeE/YedE family protein [Methylococcaceae bacterium]|nr:YeeE/YedE family protein [Methylococcaceae bacterium]